MLTCSFLLLLLILLLLFLLLIFSFQGIPLLPHSALSCWVAQHCQQVKMWTQVILSWKHSLQHSSKSTQTHMHTRTHTHTHTHFSHMCTYYLQGKDGTFRKGEWDIETEITVGLRVQWTVRRGVVMYTILSNTLYDVCVLVLHFLYLRLEIWGFSWLRNRKLFMW